MINTATINSLISTNGEANDEFEEISEEAPQLTDVEKLAFELRLYEMLLKGFSSDSRTPITEEDSEELVAKKKALQMIVDKANEILGKINQLKNN